MPAAPQQLEAGRTLVCFDTCIFLGHRAKAEAAWAAIEAGGGSHVQALVPLVSTCWHCCGCLVVCGVEGCRPEGIWAGHLQSGMWSLQQHPSAQGVENGHNTT